VELGQRRDTGDQLGVTNSSLCDFDQTLPADSRHTRHHVRKKFPTNLEISRKLSLYKSGDRRERVHDRERTRSVLYRHIVDLEAEVICRVMDVFCVVAT